MRGFDVVQKGSATSLLRNSNYIYFKSVPRAFISFKKKKKIRIYIGLIFITSLSSYALSTMTTPMLAIGSSMTKQQWLRIQLPAGVQRAKPSLEVLYKT